MAFAGAADAVSAVFRTTILQAAAPDQMRGRLQGVFIVVVAGGPRLGELLGGTVAERIGEGWTAVSGRHRLHRRHRAAVAAPARVPPVRRAAPHALRPDGAAAADRAPIRSGMS